MFSTLYLSGCPCPGPYLYSCLSNQRKKGSLARTGGATRVVLQREFQKVRMIFSGNGRGWTNFLSCLLWMESLVVVKRGGAFYDREAAER